MGCMPTCTVCGHSVKTEKGLSSHIGQKHPDKNPLVLKHGAKKLKWMYSEMSEKQMSEELDVARTSVRIALEHMGVKLRGKSEAEKHKNAQRTPEERKAQTKAARKAQFDSYGPEGYIKQWVDENPEAHREHAKKVAPLGTPARKKNGMAGVVGDSHPSWRGGKSIYDAVKKCLRPTFRAYKHRGEQCEMCGISQQDHYRKLDVHHIVPILCGGTNEDWNLMTVCNTCHHTIEWYTRQEICNTVLVE